MALTWETRDMNHGVVEEAFYLDACFRIQPIGNEYLAECISRGFTMASENFPDRASAVAMCETVVNAWAR